MTDSQGQVFTCYTCRSQMEENDRDVPCDIKGLDGCPYWKSHGVSPGAYTLTGLDQLSWEIYCRVEAFGWDMAKTLMDVKLTPYDAEQLMDKVYLIKTYENKSS